MVDLKALEIFGTTNERLRQILESVGTPPAKTASDGLSEEEQKKNREAQERWSKDAETATKIKDRISSRLDTSIQQSLKSYRLHAAVDLAWDAVPINRETVPLQLYAQGRITMQSCADQLVADKIGLYFQKDESGKIVGISIPKYVDTCVNLVRSVVTRRVAAQSVKYNSQYPHYKYQVRNNGPSGRLVEDVVTEIVESMADAWGYRDDDVQVYRAMLLHAQCVEFVRCAWETEKQVRLNGDSEDASSQDAQAVIVREGVNFVRPHPTRVFKDSAFPWSSINHDKGCSWCGYWDIVKWGSIKGNTKYFNRSSVNYSNSFIDLLSSFNPYWSQYYTTITAPKTLTARLESGSQNDAKANIGYFDNETDDAAALIAVYYEKIVPADIGCGTYPYPVWARIVCAGFDGTAIAAEWLPSRPAAVAEYNVDDERVKNLSLAMELLPLQDQLTNLFTQLLSEIKSSQIKIIPINTDLIRDQKTLDDIESTLRGSEWYVKPFSFRFSAEKLAALGLNSVAPIQVIAVPLNPQVLQGIYSAVREVLEMAERLTAMSPNESGQPISKSNGGVSATEAAQIESTTSTVYSFISQAIDSFRDAKKRVILESWFSLGQSSFTVPITNRYPRSLLERNGFTVMNEQDIYEVLGYNADSTVPLRWMVKGSKGRLVSYDYVFSSRDGASRPINAQSATTLVQLLPIIQQPEILAAIGRDKFFEIINAILRLSGSAVDVKIDPYSGENEFPQQGDSEAAAIAQQQTSQGDIINKIIETMEQQAKQLSVIQKALGLQAAPGIQTERR